ncbi:MAG: preprotein translocase subunit YajC [Treponema sp.]|nr:preprotein translocase subunit YajC [Treponema sp.]
MNSLFLSLLMGMPPQGAEGAPAGAGGMLQMIVPLALVVVIFYFLIIRPQNKKQKETQNMLNQMKKGDKIVTIGGIHGIIQSVDDTTVVVKVDENAKIKFLKSAIATVNAKADEKKAEKEEKSDAKDESAEEESKN